MYRSMRSFVRDARHNKLLAVPAGLYAINNYLKFAMQLYFKPTTAKMLGNLKVHTTDTRRLMDWFKRRPWLLHALRPIFL